MNKLNDTNIAVSIFHTFIVTDCEMGEMNKSMLCFLDENYKQKAAQCVLLFLLLKFSNKLEMYFKK